MRPHAWLSLSLACLFLAACTPAQFALRDMGSFHVGGREVAAGLVILASVGMLLLGREEPEETPAMPESMPAYIGRQEAQVAELRRAPRLSELPRAAA